MTLHAEQQRAFDLFCQGKNIFLTGPAGTGKTFLIQEMRRWASEQEKEMTVCAMTGCAALLLGNQTRTIHSWSGIRLGRGSVDTVARYLCRDRRAAWKTTDILVVDEVSMMSRKIFELLDALGQHVRRNSSPFGGIQLVFVGDFYQLPPVGDASDPLTRQFCFESETWFSTFPIHHHIELTEIFRQQDAEYKKILQEVRMGRLSPESLVKIGQYVRPTPSNMITPPNLFATRSQADCVNQNCYRVLNEEEYPFDVEVRNDHRLWLDTRQPIDDALYQKGIAMTPLEKEHAVNALLKTIHQTQSLRLKRGSVVMCTYNLDLEKGVCNGSQGLVVGFQYDEHHHRCPVVRFQNQVKMMIPRVEHQSVECPTLSVRYFPLVLSWAQTIHKIQGTTLDSAIIDAGTTVFEYGQTYVALSRVRSLEGLYLSSFRPEKIKTNPVVQDFYDKVFCSEKVCYNNQ